MGKYIMRRLLQMIPVIIGATFLIFVMVFALPGDPVAGRVRRASRARRATWRRSAKEYNLDKPLVVQYLLYMGNVLQGDLGTTFYGNTVARRAGHPLARPPSSWP